MNSAADPFALLGLPRRFDLTESEINAAYVREAMAAHPDLLAESSTDPFDDAPNEADAKAAQLNEAKRVLADPERRANALLKLLGGASKEEDRTLPPGFLMEMMETREAIETAAASRDAGQMNTWSAWAAQRRKEHIAALVGEFATLGTPPDAAGLKRIRTRLNEWRYIERLIEQLEPGYDGLSR